jgi:hypothetical protein
MDFDQLIRIIITSCESELAFLANGEKYYHKDLMKIFIEELTDIITDMKKINYRYNSRQLYMSQL